MKYHRANECNGRLFFGVFAAFAEFERELIAERTRAGLAAARARGRKGGRPRKMDRATLKATQALLANTDETAQAVAGGSASVRARSTPTLMATAR